MALTLELRNVEGAATGTVTLDEALFGIEPNLAVLHQVVTAQLAAARSGTQSTKTRAEVSGGGRKPFKQKGTGRARQGSERAPHFTGGGIALGPKPRDHRQRTPRKMIQLALRSALSDRATEGRVVVVDSWPWEVPSTKDARAALDALDLGGTVLVVLDRAQDQARRSFRNLPGTQLILSAELNAYDILCNDWIVFTPETLPGESTVESLAGAAAPRHELQRGAEASEVTDGPEADDQAADDQVAGLPVTEADDQVAGLPVTEADDQAAGEPAAEADAEAQVPAVEAGTAAEGGPVGNASEEMTAPAVPEEEADDE
jgi:large subunit ribosomal protein L4